MGSKSGILLVLSCDSLFTCGLNMVAPVTPGPLYRIERGNTAWYLNQTRNYLKEVTVNQRQKKPFNLPLAYSCNVEEWKILEFPFPVYGVAVNPGLSYDSATVSYTTNAFADAYGKFREACYGDMASWAVNVVQYRESFDLLTNSILELYRIARSLKRGDIRGLLVNLTPPSGWRPKAKSFAGRWLEWSFAIKPIMQDVNATVEALKRDIVAKSVKVHGRGNTSWSGSQNLTPDASQVFGGTVTQKCIMGGTITVTNPNALLWTSLGLTNPLAVVYDAIPFSFVANYFVSIEPWIQGLSPWYGVNLTNTYTSLKTVRKGYVYSKGYTYYTPPEYRARRAYISGYKETFSRTPGAFALPALRVRDPWILSPARAANAVSLLLQQLR